MRPDRRAKKKIFSFSYLNRVFDVETAKNEDISIDVRPSPQGRLAGVRMPPLDMGDPSKVESLRSGHTLRWCGRSEGATLPCAIPWSAPVLKIRKGRLADPSR